MTLQNIGFIGLGVMGLSMTRNLMDAGYKLHVHTRTKSKADPVLPKAQWHDDPNSICESCDIIFTMLGFPEDVKAIYHPETGLLKHAKPNTILVDFTTSDPCLAQELSEEGEARQISVLDAPVSGGDVGAQNGTLSIMVGGPEKAFNRIKPILEAMGTNIVHHGEAGKGQHVKMVNQIAIAASMVAVSEALAYSTKVGLDPDKLFQSIGSGAAGSWTLSNLGPRMLASNFDPGFYVKHFIKDMDIAMASAKKMNLKVPGLELARSLYEQLIKKDHGDSGTQALYTLFDSQN